MKQFRWNNNWFRNILVVIVLPLLTIIWSNSSTTQAVNSYMSAAKSRYAIAGTRLGDCILCHPNNNVNVLNSYANVYVAYGYNFAAIENLDSDGDGVTNLAEIQALTFPGDAADVPHVPTATPTTLVPTATPTTLVPTATPTTLVPTATPTTLVPTATPTSNAPITPFPRLPVGRIDPRFATPWIRGGGQELYGLPLTDAITEGSLIVQYFERARFEYHPELVETSSTVVVTKLGIALGYEESPQSPPYPPDTWYFASTGHTIAEPFRTFWSTQGSVLTFGYPIGEPFMKNGILMQYFERVRMEQTSTNTVQLGNLGEELMLKNGISSPVTPTPVPPTPTPIPPTSTPIPPTPTLIPPTPTSTTVTLPHPPSDDDDGDHDGDDGDDSDHDGDHGDHGNDEYDHDLSGYRLVVLK